jgi:hypothetical protein
MNTCPLCSISNPSKGRFLFKLNSFFKFNSICFIHKSAYWASFFPERSLHALAVHPPLVHPTHYTGDPSHVSDTEQSQVLNLEEPFIIESGAAIEGVSVADLEPLDIHHIEL